MPAYLPEDLAVMFKMATLNTSRIREAAHTGGDPVGLMNEIFDVSIVIGMWREELGGYGQMPLKGIDHLERIATTGQAEPHAISFLDTGTEEAAIGICEAYCENADARWVEAFVDGRPVGMGLV